MSFKLATNVLRAPAAASARAFSSSARANYAKMTLLGRLTAAPEVRQTRNDKSYVKYTVVTNEQGAPDADGKFPEPVPNYHTVFAFGEQVVERLQKIPKGALVLAEADFKITTEDGKTNVLAQHRAINVISRPKGQSGESSGEEDHFN